MLIVIAEAFTLAAGSTLSVPWECAEEKKNTLEKDACSTPLAPNRALWLKQKNG